MKKETKIKIIAMGGALALLIGCSEAIEKEVAEAAQKYSEEVARAIIEGSWRMACALFIGFVVNGMLS